MAPEDIVRLANSPAVATLFSSAALLVSLYVLYSVRAVFGKKKRTADAFFSAKKRTAWASLPAFMKDTATLGFVLVAASVLFSPWSAAAFSDVKENVRFGILFLGQELSAVRYAADAASDIVALEAGVAQSGDAADGGGDDNDTDTDAAGAVPENGADGVSRARDKKKTEQDIPLSSVKDDRLAGKKSALSRNDIAAPALMSSDTPAPIPPPMPVSHEAALPESPEPAPDVTPSALSHYGSFLVPGELMSFSVIVKNSGTDDAAFFNSRLFIDEGNDGARDMSFAEQQTQFLKKGGEETKIWRSAWMQKPGTHRAEVCADTGNTIFESNERNNCASIVFTIQGSEASGDLVVVNASITPPGPLKGNNVSFFAHIENIGSAKTSGSYAHLRVDSVLLGRYRVPGLTSGESEKIEWRTIWKAEPGDHRYEICADGNKEAFETNEDNNCAVGTFFVSET